MIIEKRERLEPPGIADMLARLAHADPKDILVALESGPQARLDLLVLKDMMVTPDQPVRKGMRELLVNLDPRDISDPQAPPELQVRPGPPDLTDQSVREVRWPRSDL